MSIHQSLVDKAYDRWRDEWKDLSYEEFISRLPERERFAVLTGNLNYQVENGGFSQWAENGFLSTAPTLLDLLKRYADRPVIAKVRQIVAEAVRVYDSRNPDATDWNRLSELDQQYCAIKEEFLQEIESILSENE